jgi:hypothetical protein
LSLSRLPFRHAGKVVRLNRKCIVRDLDLAIETFGTLNLGTCFLPFLTQVSALEAV